MLNQAFKVDAEDKLHWISIISAPHMEKEKLDTLVSSYKMASHDIIELITPYTDYSDIRRIKKAMESKDNG